MKPKRFFAIFSDKIMAILMNLV